MTEAGRDFRYTDAAPTWANAYLWPVLRREVEVLCLSSVPRRRAFDLGCGNGATADMLASLGFDVTGVDPSSSGIALAKSVYPRCHFEVGSAYDDLSARFGRFPLVVSLEVIEHVYDPRRYARALYDLVEPGGTAIVSTPYHGYLKNVALALTGKLDEHFTALWDGGHIKFFSIAHIAATSLRGWLPGHSLRSCRPYPAGSEVDGCDLAHLITNAEP